MLGMSDRNDDAPQDESAGSLADAIAAHLALKREHGADPEAVEHELEDALSPAEPEEPDPEPELPPEPEPQAEAEPEPVEAEPDPEPAPPAEPKVPPVVEDGSEPDPEPISEEDVADSVEEPRPGEITGTIEFEFGDDKPEPEPDLPPEPEHDLLEDTPDFFEETPEHDKLWFDEKPPRKFDF
jgi:hypothetical protein